MKTGLILILVGFWCASCHQETDEKAKLINQTDSLLSIWNVNASSIVLKPDSFDYIKSIGYKQIMSQLILALKSDTLTTEEVQTMENFFAAHQCYEKNYFLFKKNKYFALMKLKNLGNLKKDIASGIIFSEAGRRIVMNEISDLKAFSDYNQKLKEEYVKCKGLLQDFLRDALKIYSHHKGGRYPQFFIDSIPIP
ncbi:MAG: hypothetical protein N3F09_10815 [Bacteroidia bacterium]|nr:hypothetical protein [Bacteroidia bacterium]